MIEKFVHARLLLSVHSQKGLCSSLTLCKKQGSKELERKIPTLTAY